MHIKIVLCLIVVLFLCSCQAGIHNSSNSNNSSESVSISGEAEKGSNPQVSRETSSNNSQESKTSPSDTSVPEPVSADDPENYQDACERATALEEYLRANLSGDDYGGMYLVMGDKVELTVLAINRGNVDKVIDAYTGKTYKVNTVEGDYCPHSKLEAFAEKVEALNSPSERKIIAILSEENNWVAVNVYKDALPEFENSINEIAAELSMPEGSWKLVILDPNGENPNT